MRNHSQQLRDDMSALVSAYNRVFLNNGDDIPADVADELAKAGIIIGRLNDSLYQED